MPPAPGWSLRRWLAAIIVLALLPAALLCVFAWRARGLLDDLFLLVMIGFAGWLIWLALDRLVVRQITGLHRIAAVYRAGHYVISPDLTRVPVELRFLGDTMHEMAQGIADRDHRLRDTAETKIALIKEIHHRVKNNLQIVISLLSIQAQQVQDACARDALLQAQTRINALALVHRILNETEHRSVLDIKQLLEELCHQVAGGMDSDTVVVQVDVPSRLVDGNVAVALALFTVEALTNIFHHAFPDQRAGVIAVSLQSLPGAMLRLAIADNGLGFAAQPQDKSAGARLIKTFGLQLRGVSTILSQPGMGTTVDLVFPDPGEAGKA